MLIMTIVIKIMPDHFSRVCCCLFIITFLLCKQSSLQQQQCISRCHVVCDEGYRSKKDFEEMIFRYLRYLQRTHNVTFYSYCLLPSNDELLVTMTLPYITIHHRICSNESEIIVPKDNTYYCGCEIVSMQSHNFDISTTYITNNHHRS